MIPAAAAAPAAGTALDPTTQVLLTIFGAALVTALSGFAGAALQARRDHKRWIRQERLAAYVNFLQLVYQIWALLGDYERLSERGHEARAAVDELAARLAAGVTEEEREAIRAQSAKNAETLDDLEASLNEVQTGIKALEDSAIELTVAANLLGPQPVAVAAAKITDASGAGAAEIRLRINRLESTMRSALGISR